MAADEVEVGKAKATGIISIFILIFGFIDAVTGFVYVGYGGKDGNGLWLGCLLLLTGILGIITWVKRNKMVMVFFMVLSIIDIILCVVQVILAIIGLLIWEVLKAAVRTKCELVGGHCECTGEDIPVELEDCSWIEAFESMFLLLVIVNAICAIFVFSASIIGCIATCCSDTPRQPASNVVVVQGGPMITSGVGGQHVVISTGPGGAPMVIGGGQQPIIMTQQGYPGQAIPMQQMAPPAYTPQATDYVPGQYPMADQAAALPPKAAPPPSSEGGGPAPDGGNDSSKL